MGMGNRRYNHLLKQHMKKLLAKLVQEAINFIYRYQAYLKQ